MEQAITRAGKVIAEALAESEGCPLHLENTAGAGGTLGRSFDELAALLEAAGGGARLGICLDSCHLYALRLRHPRRREGLTARRSTSASPPSGTTAWARCTSTTRQPRWVQQATATRTWATARLGAAGCATFLCEPRSRTSRCVIETPGKERQGPDPEEVAARLEFAGAGIRRRRRWN